LRHILASNPVFELSLEKKIMSTSGMNLPPGYTLETPSTPSTPQTGGGVITLDKPGLPPGYSLEQPVNNQAPSTGAITNDVGNTVIVPKDGESFSDTMQRAAQQGKQTTPAQVDAETATAPKKVAQTLVAAPLIGAAGSAALAAPSEIYDAAITHLDQLTKVVKAAKTLGWTGFGLKEAHDIFKMVVGDKK
jgi:hypothetical protein